MQISTGTSELRDITKMERIGGELADMCIMLFLTTQTQVPIHTFAVWGSTIVWSLDKSQNSQGLVGQVKARKATGMILKMVQEGRIAGPPSTGKTAIALGEFHSYPTPH